MNDTNSTEEYAEQMKKMETEKFLLKLEKSYEVIISYLQRIVTVHKIVCRVIDEVSNKTIPNSTETEIYSQSPTQIRRKLLNKLKNQQLESDNNSETTQQSNDPIDNNININDTNNDKSTISQFYNASLDIV